jgi:hypothetical protein
VAFPEVQRTWGEDCDNAGIESSWFEIRTPSTPSSIGSETPLISSPMLLASLPVCQR